jgi:hypothetical protein
MSPGPTMGRSNVAKLGVGGKKNLEGGRRKKRRGDINTEAPAKLMAGKLCHGGRK